MLIPGSAIYYIFSGRQRTNTRDETRSCKFAPNNKNDEQDKDGDNGDGNDAIRGHAAAR
jgi:hypothetical protein